MPSLISMFLLNMSPLGNSRFPSSRLAISSSFVKIWRRWVLSCLLDKEVWWRYDKPVDGRKLFVSGLYHNSFIEVNEEGTEEGYGSCFRLAGYPFELSRDLDFAADHPFAFVIRENRTNVILFVGSVVNPLGN